MVKIFQHKNYPPNKLFNRFSGHLALTILCLITISGGMAAFFLKSYQTKTYWSQNQQKYFGEKEALELCHSVFKILQEKATKDTIITSEKEGKIHFIDTLTKKELDNIETTYLGNSIKIFSNPNDKHFIPYCFQTEGLRQTLDAFFQKEIQPTIQKNYTLIRNRWNSLKNNSTLDSTFFEPYLKSWKQTDKGITLTFLNPFDRPLNTTEYKLTLEIETTTKTIKIKPHFNSNLDKGKSCKISHPFSDTLLSCTLNYGTIFKKLTSPNLMDTKSKTSTTKKVDRQKPWIRPKIPTTPIKQKIPIIIDDKIYFKTQTPLQRLNACLFFHERLEPTITFGKKDDDNMFFWNNILFNPSAAFFNLNANKINLKKQLKTVFKELSDQNLTALCDDIHSRQPFYDVYTFTSNLKEDLANTWNKLSNPPIFVVREECFIIESQVKKSQKNASVQCRLWIHREATSNTERTWIIDKIEYKHF